MAIVLSFRSGLDLVLPLAKEPQADPASQVVFRGLQGEGKGRSEDSRDRSGVAWLHFVAGRRGLANSESVHMRPFEQNT